MLSFAHHDVDRTRNSQNAPEPTAYPLKVRELLELPSFAGSRLLAGSGGIDVLISGIDVMDTAGSVDLFARGKRQELLLTSGFPLLHLGGRDCPPAASGGPPEASALVRLVETLVERGVAALGVKAGRYLDDLPDEMLRAADRLDFPIMRLPQMVAFEQLLAGVFTELVDRQAWALDIADRLHRALTTIVAEGGGQPQLADQFARLFDAAVLICTLDGRLQTLAGDDDQIAGLNALDLIDSSGRFRIESIQLGLQSVDAAAPDSSPGQLAVAPIVAGGTDLARIVAYRRNGGLTAATMQALERTATVSALGLTKQLAMSAVESKLRGDFLRDLLAGTAGPSGNVVDRSRQLGWNIDRPLLVVVAELDPVGRHADAALGGPTASRWPQEQFAAQWQETLEARDKTIPVVGYSNEVLALIPVPSTGAEEVIAELMLAIQDERSRDRRTFSAGVSRVVNSADDLPGAYHQAQRSVSVGRRMSGAGTVAHFDRLGAYRLLTMIGDPTELRSFANDALGSLVEDTNDANELRETLQALLDSNCNVAETSRVLGFHYNTLRYRIAKLERMIGPFTTDAHLRLNVNLALQVSQMQAR
jgi:purine catabolism regulator